MILSRRAFDMIVEQSNQQKGTSLRLTINFEN